MYWKTYEPVAEEEIKEVEIWPEDYFDKDKYDSYYKGNHDLVRKYIGMSKLYEFLAFTYALKQLKIRDTIGDHWTKLWTDQLSKQKQFLDVHESYRHYYPEFTKFVDTLIKEK